MKRTQLSSYIKWGVGRLTPLLPLLLLAGLIMPSTAHADGGLAMSGSFYRQTFEIPQGSKLNVPSIYVVVFNNTSAEINVRMTWDAPLGVNVMLSEDDFALKPGEQRKVHTGVEVTEAAAPGDYTITVNAESCREGVKGIQLMGATSQSAALKVIGDSARVKVQTVSPGGEPVMAVVRLFRIMNGGDYESDYSDTGTLESVVSPGDFTAAAYVGGNKLAEENFSLVANEEKTVSLTAATVYFEGFDVVPNYHTQTGKLAFAEVVYTVNNLYKAFPEVEVVLKVSHGNAEEELSLANLAPLEKGRVGLRYNYTPQGGWEQASYGFRLQLYADGEVYTKSTEKMLQSSEGSAVAGGGGGSSAANFNWMLIGGIAAGVVVLTVIIAALSRRRA